jgi:hypothetical protein
MAKPIEFNWTTQDRIRSHEAYLRGSRSVAATSIATKLNWATAESGTPTPDEEVEDVLDPDVKFPDTLMDDPKDSDDAVDHSDGTKPHDTSAGFAVATNWDALLDTAGIPTDGTPPDPLAAQQQQEQLEEQAARQAQMLSKDTGAPQPGTAPLAPVSPEAQDRATQRQRAGRGVEGCGDEGPTNPMDPGSKYDWDSFSTTPRL